MKDLLVGVDVGTTHLKVGVFDTEGALVAMAQRGCAPIHLPDGRVEVAPDLWWDAFTDSLQECLRAVDCSGVRAIAVSGQAQTYVLLNGGGNPVGPARSWLDATGDAAGTAAALSGRDYYAHTGWLQPSALLAACKLRRGAEQQGAWPSGRRLLFADGYLLFRLTGKLAVSRNLAAMSGLYSLEKGDWWPDALECAGTPREALPPLHEVGQAVGGLAQSLAREWGLDRMPVVAGANDQTAAALAAGLAQPGEAALGLGTAFVAYQVVRRDAPPPASRSYRGTYIGGLAYELALCSTAGAMMEWTRELFANGRNWDEIMAEALSAEPGCAGLRANPNFGADCREPGGPEATAALVGLRLRHERRHLLRAVLEGAACAAREQLDTLDAGGTIAVTGSGSANTEWMQLLADVTGRRLQRMAQSQATLWGTALLAGHGAGLFTDLLETARSRRQGGETFSPSGGNDGVYAQVYRDYLEISQSVQSGARRGRRPTEGARTSEASSEGVKRGA